MSLELYVLYVKNWIESLKREEGQDLSEYAVLVGIIVVLVVATLLLIGPEINRIFNELLAQLQAVP
jgi:pilus assembly protein Flp/PilA